MFSGYIFDVEGTLVDSVPQSLRSLQKALDQAGLQVPYATLQRQVSEPLTASGRYLRRSLSAAARLLLRPTAKAQSSSITYLS